MEMPPDPALGTPVGRGNESPAGAEFNSPPAVLEAGSELPTALLLALAGYWLGISTIFAGLLALLGGRLEYEHLVPSGTEGSALLQMTAFGSLLALIVQPTVGTISDYTTSRWGRRRPYIVIGALFDVAFLAGIALSNTVLAIAAFFLLLQFSSNLAQGPFQGFVPDIVPPGQVGMASGLIALMRVIGTVLGYAVGAAGIASGQYAIATLALAAIEVTAMVATVIGVREERAGRDRQGRSWLAIAREAWGFDILRERSFVWFVVARLFILMASGVLLSLMPFYLARCFDMNKEAAGAALLGLAAAGAMANGLSVVPAARLSDRIGRKPTISAACGLGFVALMICAAAPALPVAFIGVVIYGVATGTFLAVDWALLSDLVPRIASGRYMGLSNVATATAGILVVAFAGTTMDLVSGPGRDPSGPRAALLLGAAWFVVGALLLRPVREPRRAAPQAGTVSVP
jgi:MFS family permease